jgi:hypothetical protein
MIKFLLLSVIMVGRVGNEKDNKLGVLQKSGKG